MMVIKPEEAKINFTVLQDFTRAAAAYIAGIEECIRQRWQEAIDDAEGMKVIMDRLIAEFQKGV